MVAGCPAVPAPNVDKTRGQPWRLFDEPGFLALLTVGDVAQLLRVSRWTVSNRIERRELPAVRVSNAIRVRREDLEGLSKARDANRAVWGRTVFFSGRLLALALKRRLRRA
jgi:excisionase family DNA binding protein